MNNAHINYYFGSIYILANTKQYSKTNKLIKQFSYINVVYLMDKSRHNLPLSIPFVTRN